MIDDFFLVSAFHKSVFSNDCTHCLLNYSDQSSTYSSITVKLHEYLDCQLTLYREMCQVG